MRLSECPGPTEFDLEDLKRYQELYEAFWGPDKDNTKENDTSADSEEMISQPPEQQLSY